MFLQDGTIHSHSIIKRSGADSRRRDQSVLQTIKRPIFRTNRIERPLTDGVSSFSRHSISRLLSMVVMSLLLVSLGGSWVVSINSVWPIEDFATEQRQLIEAKTAPSVTTSIKASLNSGPKQNYEKQDLMTPPVPNKTSSEQTLRGQRPKIAWLLSFPNSVRGC